MLTIIVRISTDPASYGSEATEEDAQDLAEWQQDRLEEYLRERYPDAEVEIRVGGHDESTVDASRDGEPDEDIEREIGDWMGEIWERQDDFDEWRG